MYVSIPVMIIVITITNTAHYFAILCKISLSYRYSSNRFLEGKSGHNRIYHGFIPFFRNTIKGFPLYF